MAWWTDPWLVGIGASTASGLIVWFLTSVLFRKKDDAQYRRQVEAANEHVVNSLRPAISEDSLPDVTVIFSLRSAHARKFQVREEDVWPVDAILDELIREVMDSSFIGERVKKTYAQQLVAAKASYYDQLRLMEEQARQSAAIEVRPKENSGWSALFGLMAMGGTAALLLQFTEASTWMVVLAAVAVPAGFVVLAAVVFVLVSNLGRKSKEQDAEDSTPPPAN